MAKRPRTALIGSDESGNVPIVRTVPYNNGLKRVHFLFNSDNRDFGTNERPGFYLTGFGNAIKHAHVSVRNVVLPMTFYPVDENSGVFSFATDSGEGTVTLEPGWYTAATLAAEAQSKLVAVTSKADISVYASDATYNPNFNTNGLLKIRSASDALLLRWMGTSSNTSAWAHRLFGFAANTQYTGTTVSGAQELPSIYPCDLLAGIRSIDVGCTLGPPHYWDSIDNSIRRTIERIPLPAEMEFGDTLVYEPPNMSTFIVEDFSSHASMQFDLTDNRDLPMDLNGHSWAIEMIVDPVDV